MPSPWPVLHVLAPAPAGGLETVVRTLAQAQARSGRPAAVAALVEAAGHPFVRAAMAEGLAVEEIVAAPRGYLAMRRALGRVMALRRPGVVHTHGYVADVVAASAARAARVPVVSTAHGFTGGGWRNRLYETIQRSAFRRAQGVIAVAAPLRDQLARSGVPVNRLWLVRNAWRSGAVGLAREEARARLGIPADATVLGWVGRLSREKGADLFLKALALLPPLPGGLAMLIGDGGQRAHLEALAREVGLPVRFAGLVPEAGSCFTAFDRLVLSSRTEGTPMVLFEAMAAGVPIVAVRVGGVPDVVGDDDAFLAEPGQPDSLARAIARSLADPDQAARRAERARGRLATEFGLDRWVEAHETVYRALRGEDS